MDYDPDAIEAEDDQHEERPEVSGTGGYGIARARERAGFFSRCPQVFLTLSPPRAPVVKYESSKERFLVMIDSQRSMMDKHVGEVCAAGGRAGGRRRRRRRRAVCAALFASLSSPTTHTTPKKIKSL
jgi:hypothetical protein